jgi:uncharacterized protein YgbK (DUF1537 family)
MYTLLVLADDLTGALDTGVQFAKGGIPTQVCLNWRGGGAGEGGTAPSPGGTLEKGGDPNAAGGGEALVINTGTRHCSPAEARGIVGGILEQYPAVPYIYKKTDSTLRGHIGAELEALIRGRNLGVLPFIPAYPALGRCTRRGRQYLDGVPIDKTAMAADALNPVRRSFIPDIIAEESELPVRLVPRRGPGEHGGEGGTGPEIRVYDAESNADLRDIARSLERRGGLGTTAGCAGFAEFLVEFIPGVRDSGPPAPDSPAGACPGPGPDKRPVLIISGSRHPVSLAQVGAAQEADIPALAVEGNRLLYPGWLEGEEAASIVSRCGELLRTRGCCILGTRLSLGQGPAAPEGRAKPVSETGEKAKGAGEAPPGSAAAGLLGRLAGRVLKISGPAHLAVFGGDTLLGIMEALGCRLLRPLREIRPGVVLARAESPGGDFSIAAKSGAFGEPGLIAELIDFFRRGN